MPVTFETLNGWHTQMRQLAAEAERLVPAEGEMSAEDSQRFDAIHVEVEALQRKIEAGMKQRALAERLENQQRTIGAPISGGIGAVQPPGSEDGERSDDPDDLSDTDRRQMARELWYRGGFTAMSPQQRSLIRNDTVTVEDAVSQRASQRALRDAIQRVSAGADLKGGILIGDGSPLDRFYEQRKRYDAFEKSNSPEEVTSHANPIPLHYMHVGDSMGERLGPERLIGDAQDPQFSKAVLEAHWYTSGKIRIPLEFLEDPTYKVEQKLLEEGSRRIFRRFNREATFHNGMSGPHGVIHAAGDPIYTAAPDKFTWEEAIDLFDEVDPDYSEGVGEVMVARGALNMMKKWKGTDGRPLWQPSIAVGEPPTIDDFTYFVNYSMGRPEPGKPIMAHGDFSLFIRRRVGDVRIFRLQEVEMDRLQIVFIVAIRLDAKLADPNAIKVLSLANAA